MAAPVDRIVSMLSDEAPERRLAAAIVLGELKPKGAKVVAALALLLEQDGPALQRHALDALRRIGVSQKTLPAIWPRLSSRDAEVRAAAAAAVASMGEEVVPAVRERLTAAEGEERRALESVLSQLGGREAFDALLSALEIGDEESNRATALELRRHVKDADAKTRRGYRSRIEKTLTRLAKAQPPAVSAMAAAVKVLGYLEDAKTAPALLALAKDAGQPAAVRQEALIALRFTMSEGATKEVVEALVDAASARDRALAQTALMTLAGLPLPASLALALGRLALHPELDRARIAVDKLGTLSGAKADEALLEILATGDKRRAELAAEALESRPGALEPLAKMMAETDEPERNKLLRRVLEPRLGALKPASIARLLDAAVTRLVAGSDAWESPFALAAEADPKRAGARLTAEAAKLRKARKVDAEARVLTALTRSGHADDGDRYRLASLALRESKLDPRARGADRALRQLAELSSRGFDVAKAMQADRSVGLEQLYYVGFCFLEDDVAGGDELLAAVVAKGGRKKIAQAAKNKRKLAGLE